MNNDTPVSIGGRPLSKIVTAFIIGVLGDGIILILDRSGDWLTLGKDGWIALLIATFAPIFAAYIKRLNGQDVAQVKQANRPGEAEPPTGPTGTTVGREPPY